MALQSAVVQQASERGLDLVSVGDRVEARKGKRVVAFHISPEKCLNLALERLEEDRLRQLDKLPSQREPLMEAPAKVRQKLEEMVNLPVVISDIATAVEIDLSIPQTPSNKIIKGSIIKKQYKDRYKMSDFSCGDDLACELKAYVGVGGTTDLSKLREVAETNGVWSDKYGSLNPGQQRMTIGNRLRFKLKAGERLDIGGAILQNEYKD